MSKDCKNYTTNTYKRVRRLSYQIQGIEKMIAEGRDYELVLQQVAAVRAALSKLAVEILKDQSQECLRIKIRQKARKL